MVELGFAQALEHGDALQEGHGACGPGHAVVVAFLTGGLCAPSLPLRPLLRRCAPAHRLHRPLHHAAPHGVHGGPLLLRVLRFAPGLLVLVRVFFFFFLLLLAKSAPPPAASGPSGLAVLYDTAARAMHPTGRRLGRRYRRGDAVLDRPGAVVHRG